MGSKRAVLGILVTLMAAATGLASWMALDPSSVADTCPVVVTGEIVKVAEAAAEAGGRVLDVARIRIAEVRKNLIVETDAKPGELIEARMHSRKDKIRTSNDLRYPVGTKAMWMLYLGEDGAFYINRRPEQCQRDEETAKRIVLTRMAYATVAGRPRPFTREEWIARERERLRKEAEERAARKKRWDATEDAISKGISALYDDNVLQPDRLPTLLALPVEVRSALVNKSERELAISRDDWITIHCFLARKEPIENHRVRALPLKIDGSQRLKELLLESLTDASSRMRLFACVRLMLSEDKDPAVVSAVAKLLDDDMRDVQMMAVRALERLGDKSHLKPILALCRGGDVPEEEADTFALTLARLGETEVALACFRKAMTSANWNIRHTAIQALEAMDARHAVPAAIAALPGELRHTIQDRRDHGVGDRAFTTLVAALVRHTGEGHGKDAVAWLNWWQEAAENYGVKDARVNLEEARKLQAEYQETFAKARPR